MRRNWNDGGWDGKRLQALMESASLTTTGLASRLHVAEQTVKNWLVDAHRISLVHQRHLDRIEKRYSKVAV